MVGFNQTEEVKAMARSHELVLEICTKIYRSELKTSGGAVPAGAIWRRERIAMATMRHTQREIRD